MLHIITIRYPPILWYDDIRKYIGRLRKWFLKEYGDTIRYYIICEYGSQSFRPHSYPIIPRLA